MGEDVYKPLKEVFFLFFLFFAASKKMTTLFFLISSNLENPYSRDKLHN